MRLGEYSKALEIAEYLVDRDPLCTICNRRLASLYELIERYDEAEAQYEHAYVTAGKSIHLLFKHGFLQFYRGDFENALVYFDQLPANSPEQIVGRAAALYRLERFEEFSDLYNQLQQLTPPHHVALAIVHAVMGDRTKTEQLFQQAAQSNEVALRQPRWNFLPLYRQLGWERPNSGAQVVEFNPQLPWELAGRALIPKSDS